MTKLRLLVALSAAVLTIGVPAHAQSKGKAPRKARETAAQPAAETPASDPAASGKTAAKSAPRKVVRLEEMRVEGRVQKPQALFLMPRANVTSGEDDRSESFLQKTKDAVTKDPF